MKASVATEATETRLARLEAYLGIRQAVAAYGPAADCGDGDAYLALWADDAVYAAGDLRLEGRAGLIEALASPFHLALIEAGSAHVSSLPYIVIEGARAVVTTENNLFKSVDGAFPAIRLSATRWEFEQDGGSWRLRRRENQLLQANTAARALLARHRQWDAPGDHHQERKGMTMSQEPEPTPLESRLRHLESYMAISQIIAGYGPAADSGDDELYLDVWAEDGEYETAFGVFRGRDGLRDALATDLHRGLIETGSGHISTLPYIVIDGDAASATTYHTLFKCIDGTFPCIRLSASRWEFACRHGQWELVKRTSELLQASEKARRLLARYKEAPSAPL
jgi:ketosteroid isomerase-like protein